MSRIDCKIIFLVGNLFSLFVLWVGNWLQPFFLSGISDKKGPLRQVAVKVFFDSEVQFNLGFNHTDTVGTAAFTNSLNFLLNSCLHFRFWFDSNVLVRQHGDFTLAVKKESS